MQPQSRIDDCKLLKVVARDGIGPPTVVDSTQVTVLSSPQMCQTAQISNSLAQIWHKIRLAADFAFSLEN